MGINLKFDRKVNIRMRATDRQIVWYAIGTAVLAHVVFFGIFDYRRPTRAVRRDDSAVTMLSAGDFSAEEREGFRNWLDYHDPRNFGMSDFGDEVTDGVLREVRPPRLAECPKAVVAVRPAAVGKFREVPGRKLPERMLPPPPPRGETAPAADFSAGKVTDGGGRVLPLGNVELPPRTARTVGSTVLRVFSGSGGPVLLLDRSCGDGGLDRFALGSLSFLKDRKPVPEYIIIEWPEKRK